jgi:hypothetical protein
VFIVAHIYILRLAKSQYVKIGKLLIGGELKKSLVKMGNLGVRGKIFMEATLIFS